MDNLSLESQAEAPPSAKQKPHCPVPASGSCMHVLRVLRRCSIVRLRQPPWGCVTVLFLWLHHALLSKTLTKDHHLQATMGILGAQMNLAHSEIPSSRPNFRTVNYSKASRAQSRRATGSSCSSHDQAEGPCSPRRVNRNLQNCDTNSGMQLSESK